VGTVGGWEYRATTDPADLETLGREGWELVSVTPRGAALVHYLRRPLPTLAERVTLEQRDRAQRSPAPDRRAAAPTPPQGILNPELLALVGRAGHTDSITICDRGFPVPVGPARLDLSLVDDVPTVPQVLAAVQTAARLDRILMASEVAEVSPHRLRAMRAEFPDLPLELVPHLELKRLSQCAKGTVRTGDTCHYANVIAVIG
jgi:D-ribose pyranase